MTNLIQHRLLHFLSWSTKQNGCMDLTVINIWRVHCFYFPQVSVKLVFRILFIFCFSINFSVGSLISLIHWLQFTQEECLDGLRRGKTFAMFSSWRIKISILFYLFPLFTAGWLWSRKLSWYSFKKFLFLVFIRCTSLN